MSGHILAIGGGHAGSPLEDFLLELAATSRPRICFVGTASAHQPEYVETFYDAFRARPCRPTHLELFGMPEDPAAHVAAQDAIYVGGGNTANMLAIWRVHGVDRALREAWERGAVLGGWSAGANCWFEDSVTDSYGPRLRELGGGLGFLAGSFCPHYDGEAERRPTFMRLVRDRVLPPGYAADDDAALHFEGTELREVVSQREGAQGWRVTPEGEEALEPRLLAK
ncbi:MAG TPA: peptidase E [Gaiellaceae bacterium]|nr:peptidase E [Gaiellaceae bacterium]